MAKKPSKTKAKTQPNRGTDQALESTFKALITKRSELRAELAKRDVLETNIAALQRAIAAGSKSLTTGLGVTVANGVSKSGASVNRAPRILGQLDDKAGLLVCNYLRNNPGQASGEIKGFCQKHDLTPSQTETLIKKLCKGQRIEMRGKRAAARYFVNDQKTATSVSVASQEN